MEQLSTLPAAAGTPMGPVPYHKAAVPTMVHREQRQPTRHVKNDVDHFTTEANCNTEARDTTGTDEGAAAVGINCPADRIGTKERERGRALGVEAETEAAAAIETGILVTEGGISMRPGTRGDPADLGTQPTKATPRPMAKGPSQCKRGSRASCAPTCAPWSWHGWM